MITEGLVDSADAKIYVTKGAAAQRQLDAAIRMYLAQEDELAIHTVGAAAFRLLRDLKQQRGRGELSDAMSYGLFAIADDLAKGKLDKLPDELDLPDLKQLIAKIMNGIRTGKVTSSADVQLNFSDTFERRHWAQFNLPANFLKHADADGDGLLSESMLDNQDLLVKACVSYKSLFTDWTPEMFVFAKLWNAERGDNPASIVDEFFEMLRESSSDARRALCLELIEEMKAK
jgi:hypothetical protein